MRKFLILWISIIIAGFLCAPSVYALSYSPDPVDLADLDHSTYWYWGLDADSLAADIDGALGSGKEIVPENIYSVELTFHNIYNWNTTKDPSTLFVWLMNDIQEGTHEYADDWHEYGTVEDEFTLGTPTDGSDPNARPFDGYQLAAYTAPGDIPSGAESDWHGITLTYTFSDGDVEALLDYILDGGTVGFGFDPDCKFHNDGIELEITPIPEPGTMLLFGIGLVALAGVGRKRFMKK